MQTKGHTDVSTAPSTETDPYEVTPERAEMLAQHAIHVQGGFSTPDVEAERARKDMADGGGPINWEKMQAELSAVLMAKVAALPVVAPEPAPAPAPEAPAPAAAPQRVDVTAVLGSIDQGEGLRDRIKAMQAQLKIHEDNIKDVLGEATVGVDSEGRVLVRFPFRNRSGLVKEKVKEKLSAKDYADCETVTTYRTLHYGESESR